MGGSRILHLERDFLAGRTRESRDDKRVTRRDSGHTEVVRDGRRVVEGSRARSRLGQLGKIDLTVTAEGKG